jgi:putative transposase
LTTIEVRLHGKPMGLAIPHRVGRHAHPKARPETPPAPPPPASGIAYLPLIDAAHQAELAIKVNYAALLGGDPDQQPTTTGQDTP